MLALVAAAILEQSPFNFDYGKFADEYMSSYANAQRFSGQVLVAANDTIVFRKAYGFADWEKRLPMTLDTPCVIFSISKQFTAAAVLLLQERGRLKVDDRIRKYMPDLPAEWDAVTVHHLLTHTSGIDRMEILNFDKRKPTDKFRLKTVPGKIFEYNNFGYVLLAKLVGRVSGRPFEAFMKENVFEPLGMKHSGLGGYSAKARNMARGHVFLGGHNRVCEQDLKVIEGAGSVHSTADDMLRWSRALDHPGFLKAESLTAMFTPSIETGYGTSYGYGWFTNPKQDLWQHSGGGAGFSAFIRRHTNKNLRVILLSNLGSGNSDLPFEGLETLATGENAHGYEGPTLEEAARYTGGYHLPNGERLVVRMKDGDLSISKGNGKQHVLEFDQGRTFYSEEKPYTFIEQSGGFALRVGSEVAKKEVLTAELAKKWAGIYRCPGEDDRVFVANGSQLALAFKQDSQNMVRAHPNAVSLTYLGDNRFHLIGLGSDLLFRQRPNGDRVSTDDSPQAIAQVFIAKKASRPSGGR